MILETLRNLSFDLKQKTDVEYCCPCPWCGGDDRFIVRTDSNRFFCRGTCKRNGDEIQFIRDYKSLSYVEACQYLGIQPKAQKQGYTGFNRDVWQPKPAKPVPCDLWQKRCLQLIGDHAKILHQNKPIMNWLKSERGLTDETIKAASLGWVHSDIWRERSEFGLPEEISKKTGKPKKVWVPAGLLIPYIVDGQVIRVRVRRSDPGEGDRYILLPGGNTRPMILGEIKNTLSIVESELDALLVNQVAGDLIGVVAMGNAQIRPDDSLDQKLKNADLILNSLDVDTAGAKEAWNFWKNQYHSDRWPCVGGKDPGEMFNKGVDVRAWVLAGIKYKKTEWVDPLKSDPIDFNHAPQQQDDLGQPGQPDTVLKVEQMTVCQHGQPCGYLHHQPPERAVCQYCKTPVWDLSECPAGYWWPMIETATN